MIEDIWGSAAQLVLGFIIFLTGALVAIAAGKKLDITLNRSLGLYVWHNLMGFAFIFYVNLFGGDALGYYFDAMKGGEEFKFGTAAVKVIMTPFVQTFDLSFMNTTLLFGVIGTLGLLLFQASLNGIGSQQPGAFEQVRRWLPYLPSLSFWSAGIGKDALSFCATNMALYAALNLRGRRALFLGGVLLMLLVRPHIAAGMILGLALSAVFDPRYPIPTRAFLGIVGVAGAAVAVPFALEASGANESSSLGEYINSRQEQNQIGGGAVDIASMSLPMQIFTYVFRPLPYEAHSVFALFASLDNVLLIWLVVYAVRFYFQRRGVRLRAGVTFMLLYTAVVLPILASTTSNLGIAMRQKWMFVPMVLWVCLYLLRRPPRGRKSKIGPVSAPQPASAAASAP